MYLVLYVLHLIKLDKSMRIALLHIVNQAFYKTLFLLDTENVIYTIAYNAVENKVVLAL